MLIEIDFIIVTNTVKLYIFCIIFFFIIWS